MTYRQAAIDILKQTKTPLTTQELLDRMISADLITPHGKTPLATLSSVLYAENAQGAEIVRVFEDGGSRAARGTVRWQLSSSAKRRSR